MKRITPDPPRSEAKKALDKLEQLSPEQARRNKKFLLETVPVHVVRLDSGSDLSTIIDMLREEIDEQLTEGVERGKTRGFWHNRGILMDAFKKDQLYVLKFLENDDNYNRVKTWELLREVGFIMPCTRRTLPCFCVVEEGRMEMIWTSTAFRQLGLARKFLDHFSVKEVSLVVRGSEPFWEKCGVKIKSFNEYF